ncbi:hypothetical protein EGI26_17130 [Lacihabitans sp. CCS-44]|uniref:SRPBCC family protein n=1 Tax=Lacihabitans sp. CCS-44 TaxID=2487331 RepID=UPI0020CC3DB7|nr:SRPBCC family protein [Lacihabitans sp. CCS-44]MCP9756891.1 hypothetical protein [Lacihabitans sp. CCS-44]
MNLEKNQIGIERILNAPISLVWRMWTEPEHIQHWWGPNGFTSTIHKMEAKNNGEWKFIMHGPDGTDYNNFNIFKELVFHEKIVIIHQGPPHFELQMTFEDLGEKTKLTLISNFESEQTLKEILKEGIVEEGLKQNIEKLEAYIPTSSDFVIERTYNADISKVWEAISNKDVMKLWYFDLEEFKAEVGFKFNFVGGEPPKEYLHLCEIVEVVHEKTLAYTWAYAGYGGISTVIFELESIGTQTKLTLAHKGLQSFPSNNPDFAKKNFEAGWTSIIGTSLLEFLYS